MRSFLRRFFDRASKTCYKRAHMVNGKQTTINLDTDTILAIQKDLAMVSRAAESLQKKLAHLFPAPYGGDVWWEQSVERSKKDIAAGKYEEFDSAKDFVQYLDSISS